MEEQKWRMIFLGCEPTEELIRSRLEKELGGKVSSVCRWEEESSGGVLKGGNTIKVIMVYYLVK